MKTFKVKSVLFGLIAILAVAVLLVSCEQETLLENVITHSELPADIQSHAENADIIERLNSEAEELLGEYYTNNPSLATKGDKEKRIPAPNDPSCRDMAVTDICCVSGNGNQACWDDGQGTFIALEVTREDICNSSNLITSGSYVRARLTGIPMGFQYKVDGYVNNWQTSNGNAAYFNISLPSSPSLSGTPIGVRVHIKGSGLSNGSNIPVTFKLVGTNQYNAISSPSSTSFYVIGC